MVALLISIMALLSPAEPLPDPACDGNPVDYPAVVSVYDPELGGVNCDDDCSTVAMGPFDEDMYGAAGACDPDLYGDVIYFPSLAVKMHCVDNGTNIRTLYDERIDACVSVFDLAWPLHEDPSPEFAMWVVQDWYIVEYGRVWNYDEGVNE